MLDAGLTLLFERSLQRHSAVEPARYSAKPEPQFSVPISLAQRDSTKANDFNIAATFALFTKTCPSAIARFVIAVVVDAIQRIAVRPRSHVAQKVFKTAPRFTDGNTDGAIANVASIVSCIAPINHRPPRTIFWRSSSLLRMAMFEAGHVPFGEKHKRYFSGGVMC